MAARALTQAFKGQGRALPDGCSGLTPSIPAPGRERTPFWCTMDPSELFLREFGVRLAQLLAPTAPALVVESAVRQVLRETRGAAEREMALAPLAAPPPHAVEKHKRLELCFVHDCRHGPRGARKGCCPGHARARAAAHGPARGRFGGCLPGLLAPFCCAAGRASCRTGQVQPRCNPSACQVISAARLLTARASARRNHGCNSSACVLCKHNPNKRCLGNFARKYWVGDKLLAKCEGGILVECIDLNTGERVTDDLSDVRVEVRTPVLPVMAGAAPYFASLLRLGAARTALQRAGRQCMVPAALALDATHCAAESAVDMQAAVMDGNKFNTRCREAGEQRLEILDECEVRRAPSAPNAPPCRAPRLLPARCPVAHSALRTAVWSAACLCPASRMSGAARPPPQARPCRRPAALAGGSSALCLPTTHQLARLF